MTHKFGNCQHTGGTEGHVFELCHQGGPYIRCQRIGPNTDPCGTPHCNSSEDDLYFPLG